MLRSLTARWRRRKALPHSAADVKLSLTAPLTSRSPISAAYVGGEDADSDFTGCFSKVESRAGVLMIQYDGERYLVSAQPRPIALFDH